ncbi:MAG: sensor histidine kinase [Aggregatilineales bacterium]
MADLAQWLHAHTNQLIHAATAELSPDETLRATMQPTIASFYGALVYSAESSSYTLLHAVLINWVRSRSTLTESDHVEASGLLPIIATLKRVLWKTLREVAPSNALDLILAADDLFNEAEQYAARLESEALAAEGQRKLEVVQETVRRLDKSKSDFIAVAAHELKTPLTLIEGYSNMLRAEFTDAEHPRATLMVGGIAGGTTRLREIVEDMIDVSLIDLKLLNLHYQPVWIHRMIDIVGFDLSEPMRQRNIRFVVNRSDLTDKPTYADSERLYQALHKIVSNAVKYTPDGGTITISSRELPGFTDLQIRDSGIGIAPENLGRIFEKFSSMGDVALHSSGKIKFKGGGPGLGLAIAKGFLEAHGGSIWAESAGFDEKAMPGSIFHIMIPMRSAPPNDQMSVLFKENSGEPVVAKSPTSG